MEYVLKSFYKSTGWNEDNIYYHFTETSDNLLNFTIPRGFSVTVSSQPTSNSFTSYTLSDLGFVSGSISYLYTSKPLIHIKPSSEINLKEVIAGYKVLEPLSKQEDSKYWEIWQNGIRVDTRDTLLYGRMFLPGNALEAMFVRRLSPKSQFLVKCVSDSRYKNNGAVTFTYQYNDGPWASEYLYSTHEALLGFTGIYNIGAKERIADPSISSRLSFGGELFYAVLSKSPGLSTCLRYTAQSAYTGTPLTMSFLCNPLMGQVSTMYSLSTKGAAFGSRFDFNVYSYESDLSIGCEIWRYSKENISTGVDTQTNQDIPAGPNAGLNQEKDTELIGNTKATLNKVTPSLEEIPKAADTSSVEISEHVDRNPISVDDSFFSKKYKTFINVLDRKLSDATAQLDISNEQYAGSLNDIEEEEQELGVCFKGSTSLQTQTVNMVWEGRFKELLLSAGFGLSFASKTPTVTTLGLSVQYSS